MSLTISKNQIYNHWKNLNVQGTYYETVEDQAQARFCLRHGDCCDRKVVVGREGPAEVGQCCSETTSGSTWRPVLSMSRLSPTLPLTSWRFQKGLAVHVPKHLLCIRSVHQVIYGRKCISDPPLPSIFRLFLCQIHHKI